MAMKRTTVIHICFIMLLVLSSIVVGQRNVTYACDCAISATFTEGLEKSDIVFDGVVVGKKTKKAILGMKSSADPVEWSFVVNGSWKGDIGEEVTVISAEHSASCGYKFEVGKRYAVFAYMKDEAIRTSICSKTMQIADNSAIFNELGEYLFTYDALTIDEVPHSAEPHSPDQAATIATENQVRQNIDERKGFIVIGFGIVAILLLFGGFLIATRIRRR